MSAVGRRVRPDRSCVPRRRPRGARRRGPRSHGSASPSSCSPRSCRSPCLRPSRSTALADTGYLALAAVGLGFAVGLGGMPSLAQGAFIGLGAVTAAHAVDAGWPALGRRFSVRASRRAAGVVAGLGLVRLRPVSHRGDTWLPTWLFSLRSRLFPSLSGGARGLVVPPESILGLTPTPTVHYELALALLVARRSRPRALVAELLRPGAASRGTAAGRRRRARRRDRRGAPRRLRRRGRGRRARRRRSSVQLAGGRRPGRLRPLALVQAPRRRAGRRRGVGARPGGRRRSRSAASRSPPASSRTSRAPTRRASGRCSPRCSCSSCSRSAATASCRRCPACRPLAAEARRSHPLRRPPATRTARRRRGARAARSASAAWSRCARSTSSSAAGEIAALIGPNGSGKTTALRLLAGTLGARRGRRVRSTASD